ncbi:hypothetical protein Nmel_012705, partial [Mimus melanotis]
YFLVLLVLFLHLSLNRRKYQCCFLSLGKSFLQTSLAFHYFRASVMNGIWWLQADTGTKFSG